MKQLIKNKLRQKFNITSLTIVNESYLHKGHAGDDGSGQTHFKVFVVSDDFFGVSQVKRHKMVYDALADELKHGIHALSIKALTTQEYEN